MSRSRRKTPICGNTFAKSEKKDKTVSNRAFRRVLRAVLKTIDENTVLPEKRELSDVWDFHKDGKQYFSNEYFLKKYMRK